MSFAEAVRSVYRNYAKFDGRASRPEFWWYQLFVLLVLFGVAFAAVFLDNAIGRQGATPFRSVAGLGLLAFVLGSFIPTLAVMARRLHDTGNSGWWLLIQLIPYLGFFVLLIFMALPGNSGPNKYGPPPGQAGPDQRAAYWGTTRSDALRAFAEDAQKAAVAGYQPVYQEWKQDGIREWLEVWYERGPAEPPWRSPSGPLPPLG